jgi:hypothetical protein
MASKIIVFRLNFEIKTNGMVDFTGTGLRSADCGCGLRMRITDYGLRITDYGLRIADCGLRITDCGLRITDYGLRITDCGLRIADYGLRIADYGLRIVNPCKSFISSEKATIIACSYL